MKHEMATAGFVLWAVSCLAVAEGFAQTESLHVELSRPTHFKDIEGHDLVVPAGTYRVEARETALVLIASDKAAALVVAAASGKHEESLVSPVVLGIPVGGDEYHLVWLYPGGATLDAAGSVSGIQSRGPGMVAAATIRKFAAASLMSPMIPGKTCTVSVRPTSIQVVQPIPPTHYTTISPLTLAGSLLFENMRTNTGAPITPIAVDEQSNILGTMLTLTAPSGTYATRLAVPVDLPDGAVIRELSLLVSDALTENVRVGILGYRLSLGPVSLGTPPSGDSLMDANVESECASGVGSITLSMTNLAMPVINRDRGYLVYVFMMAKPTPGHKISPIRIGYTLQ
jgi:hypothetical protein